MKIALLLLALLCISTPVFAASCDDVQGAAKEAMKERNDQAKKVHDATMPDPEDDRNGLGSCIDAVFSLGDSFSMGVKIPSMNQIVDGMCGMLNSMIQDKINEATSSVENSVSGFGKGVLQVNGSGDSLAKSITGKIK